MRYHNITKDDMNNGDGLRVVLWVAGCDHHCKGCQNPITWDEKGGALFTEKEFQEISTELRKDYVAGLTFSGGDPLHKDNRDCVDLILWYFKRKHKDKTFWMYTGYTWEEILANVKMWRVVKQLDVLVDGCFVQGLADVDYKWAGSTNQRVIDVQKSLKEGRVVLYDNS